MHINIPEITISDTHVIANLQLDFIANLSIEKITEMLGENVAVGRRIHLLDNINDGGKGQTYVYPVIIRDINEGKNLATVVTDHSFDFSEALKLMTYGGEVRRSSWGQRFSVKWINGDSCGFIGYNCGDGYLPYFFNASDVRAKDWGIRFGYKKQN